MLKAVIVMRTAFLFVLNLALTRLLRWFGYIMRAIILIVIFIRSTSMKFIVKLQAEITIKSRPVRKRFTKILESNVKNVLRRIDEKVTTRMNWDNIEVNTKDNSPENRDRLVEALKCIPGVPMFLEVQQSEFVDVHDIYEKTLAIHAKTIENKTF